MQDFAKIQMHCAEVVPGIRTVLRCIPNDLEGYEVALDALRGDRTIQEIAAKHQVHPNQVSQWKRQAIDGMADVFARSGKAERRMEAELKELHARMERLAVENDFLSQGLKR